MFAPIYLDHNATTPLDERVLEVMLPWLRGRPGNASSRYEYGRAARDAIDRARQQVAASVNAHATEVVFVSGGSEANNTFVKGAAACLPAGAIATGAGEHPCVRKPAAQLRSQGWRTLELTLDTHGSVDLAHAEALIERESPSLVSVMLANNESGAVNDVAALARIARRAGAWLHTDAVQGLGKMRLDFRALGVHAMSLSAHKIHGPLGAGALILDKRVELSPLVAGGGQERGLRAGTENVAAIVGFGKACELATEELDGRIERMQAARQRLETALGALGAEIFAVKALRLPNTSFFAFGGIEGETLVGRLDRAGFALASGAACSSADPEPSRTLLAMGVEPSLARCAVRASVGHGTTLAEVDGFLRCLQETVKELQQLAAVAA
ncbi:MAG: cysteine desulfurase [Candidatus Dactylopiibacterium carminicum]|uniref:cysteine desulfurase n=1 Tax=Candidatus Dactylopiibacterium carminicum TaxID=857335 RepID=A0A272ER96_9RHOO|nr:cysteine desulfurase family protein [Candidatus Dactylopiibacterium carminicum]KAF7598763.1 cysteine desulfurase [Candidatus Dactylopiibacterium carminicum]PAS92602.1 MAG: cysteine desulfurase [Candidatus Dactylopiibacterium carminicum]PAS93899.1 MAG: cysteine desulfurase [Candidatus Dactylopiibacterium carminicum]PAS98786.1 MAG: cysteine desulfurase [Candidatus Dactylopiibacterium carminicum]